MTETIDEKITAQKKKELDEFDAAFDEIEGKDPEFSKALNEEPAIQKDDTKGDSLTKDSDTTPEDGADSTPVRESTEINTSLFEGLKDNQKQVDPVDDTTATPGEKTVDPEDVKGPTDERVVELEAELAKERQKTSSWSGRISAANKRADEAEAKAADLEERIAKLEAGSGPDTDGEGSTGDKSKLITDFFSEFPEFEAPLRALLAEALGTGKGVTIDEVKQAIQPEIDAVSEKVSAQTAQEKFFKALSAKHPDAQELVDSGKILDWINQQKAYIAKELERVYRQGTVTEASALLDEFKRTTGYSSQKTQEHTTTQNNDKLASMLEVESDSSGPPAGEPDKNDFDAAADEAFKEE